jgi:hypothetical protein
VTQTPGQRTASTVLDLIDGAIGGDTSPDAMRWSPEPLVGAGPTNIVVSDRLDSILLACRYLAAERLSMQVIDPRPGFRITEV